MVHTFLPSAAGEPSPNHSERQFWAFLTQKPPCLLSTPMLADQGAISRGSVLWYWGKIQLWMETWGECNCWRMCLVHVLVLAVDSLKCGFYSPLSCGTKQTVLVSRVDGCWSQVFAFLCFCPSCWHQIPLGREAWRSSQGTQPARPRFTFQAVISKAVYAVKCGQTVQNNSRNVSSRRKPQHCADVKPFLSSASASRVHGQREPSCPGKGLLPCPGAQTLNSKLFIQNFVPIGCHQHINAVKTQLSKFLAACEPPITRFWFGSFMVVFPPEILPKEMLHQQDPKKPF